MKAVLLLGLLGGLALTTILICAFGVGSVWQAVSALGWCGFALISGLHLLLIMVMGSAWWLLGRGRADARLGRFVWGRLIRDSASEALPLSQIGGFVLGARAVTLAGVDSAFAAASTVVDVCAELVGQLLYTLLGLVLLSWLHPGSELLGPIAGGLAIMTGGAVGFYVLQAPGAGLVEGLAGRLGKQFLGRDTVDSRAVQGDIQDIHRHRGAVAQACAVHFCTWVLAGLETWLTLRLMGVAIGIPAALTIDSLLYGLRSVAFFVPNALGVQEGGLVLLGAMFGVDASAALALSLIKRGRDLVIGVPALLVWQVFEGRHGLTLRSAAPAGAARSGVSRR
jgi:putative membrane protein